MKATDYYRLKVENGDISSEDALKEVLELMDNSNEFLNSLISKYTEQKTLARKNFEIFKKHPNQPWYDATFNNTLLFLFDLQDIQSRNGMSND